MRAFKGFALAFSMFTILPFFKVHDFFKGINGYSAMFYPLVGFILGAILWGVHTLLTPYLPTPHLSVIIFALWVLLTGAIHLDGFSDTVDGLFVDKKRALEVMKDSHVGGMGMIFSFVFLSLKLSSLIYLDAFYLLPIVLMFSRLNATLAIYFFEYVSSGVALLIKEELTLKHLLVALLYSLTLSYLFSSIWLSVIALVVMFVIAKFFSSCLGGLNGDIYGLIIEVSELLLLNAIIIHNFS
jgi:cobalamin 5'-phosphate synthase/cobalamin synthase